MSEFEPKPAPNPIPKQEPLPLVFVEDQQEVEVPEIIHYDRGDTELEDRAERVAKQLGF